MSLDWQEVTSRYGGGALVPTVAGGKTLQVTGVTDEGIDIRTSLWKDTLARKDLEKAVTLLGEGRLSRHPGTFAEDYRTHVADVRGTSVAHILRDLGFLD